MKRSFPVEVLWCSSNSSGKAKRWHGSTNLGWQFPKAVAKLIQEDCDGKRVLHLFGGRSQFGMRLDVDPVTKSDVLGDAWLPPFGRDSFDVVVLDPLYFRMNAQEKNSLFRASGFIAKEVIWFNTVWASQPAGFRQKKAYLVRVGNECHVRSLQYFERVRECTPAVRFQRGPAIKYNRWLNGQQGLPLIEASGQ